MAGRHGGDGETVGLLRGQLADMARRLAESDAECARLRAGLAEAEQHIRAQDEVDRILAIGLPPAATGDTGPIARVQGPRAPSHRAPRTPAGQRWLRAVPGMVPLAALLRDTWHAHHATVVAAGAATVAAPVALAAALTVAVPAPAAHPGQRAGVPAPAASASADATPIPSPSARPKPDAAKASPAATVTDGAPSFPPSAALSPPPPAPSSPPASLLSLSANELDLGVYLTGTVQLADSGDAVQWSATCSADVSLQPAQGYLEPGQQGFTVTVRINPADGASEGWCVFEPGGERVAVVWDGAGSPSAGI